MPTAPKKTDAAKQDKTDIRQDGSLKFLKDFLGVTGTSLKEAAEKVGFTPQNLSYVFSSDEIKFGTILKIFDGVGYELRLDFVKDPNEKTNYKNIDPKNVILLPDGRYRLKNLYFLIDALNRLKIKHNDFARMMDMAPNSVRMWYTGDDILWSRIVQAAHVLGFDIRIDIRRKPQPTERTGWGKTPGRREAKALPKIYYRMEIENSIDIPDNSELVKRWKRNKEEKAAPGE